MMKKMRQSAAKPQSTEEGSSTISQESTREAIARGSAGLLLRQDEDIVNSARRLAAVFCKTGVTVACHAEYTGHDLHVFFTYRRENRIGEHYPHRIFAAAYSLQLTASDIALAEIFC